MTAIYETEIAEDRARKAAELAAKEAEALRAYRRILRDPKPGDGAKMAAAMDTLGIDDAKHDADKAALAALAKHEADIRTDDELRDAEREMRAAVEAAEAEMRAAFYEMVNRLPGLLSSETVKVQELDYGRKYGFRNRPFPRIHNFDAFKEAHELLAERIPRDEWHDAIDALDEKRRDALAKYQSMKSRSERATAKVEELRKKNPRVFGEGS